MFALCGGFVTMWVQSLFKTNEVRFVRGLGGVMFKGEAWGTFGVIEKD